MIFKYKADLDYIRCFSLNKKSSKLKSSQYSKIYIIRKFIPRNPQIQAQPKRKYNTQKKKKKETVSKRTTTTARASASHCFVRVWKQRKALERDSMEGVKSFFFFFGWENSNEMKKWESFIYIRVCVCVGNKSSGRFCFIYKCGFLGF